MPEYELNLLSALRLACKNNPDLFAVAIQYMQAGVTDKINEWREHALQMEKLAVGFAALDNPRMTPSMKEWAERMVGNVRKECKFFNLEEKE